MKFGEYVDYRAPKRWMAKFQKVTVRAAGVRVGLRVILVVDSCGS